MVCRAVSKQSDGGSCRNSRRQSRGSTERCSPFIGLKSECLPTQLPAGVYYLNVLCHGGSVCKLLLSNLVALNYKALKKWKTGGDS